MTPLVVFSIQGNELTMRFSFNFLVMLNVIIFSYTSVSPLHHENFKLDENLKRVKLIEYFSKLLCSIDLKIANIYVEFESNGRFLDGVITEMSSCVPVAMTVIA